jgi:hypothetical protein
MIFKMFVLLLLISIIASLAKALFHMSSGPDQSVCGGCAACWRHSRNYSWQHCDVTSHRSAAGCGRAAAISSG